MTFCVYCLVGLPSDDHSVKDVSGFELITCPQVPADTLYLSNPDRPSSTVTQFGPGRQP